MESNKKTEPLILVLLKNILFVTIVSAFIVWLVITKPDSAISLYMPYPVFMIMSLFVGLSLFLFIIFLIIGIVKYFSVRKTEDKEKIILAKQIIIYSIIGLLIFFISYNFTVIKISGPL